MSFADQFCKVASILPKVTVFVAKAKGSTPENPVMGHGGVQVEGSRPHVKDPAWPGGISRDNPRCRDLPHWLSSDGKCSGETE